jgi:hypothetical protein
VDAPAQATVEPVVGDRSVARIERAADVDAAWCTTALAAELDGARVVAVDAEPVGTGQVADTLRLRLTYDRAGAGPATLIA